MDKIITISRRDFRRNALKFAVKLTEDIVEGTGNNDPMFSFTHMLHAVNYAKGLEEKLFDTEIITRDDIEAKINRSEFFETIEDILGGDQSE